MYPMHEVEVVSDVDRYLGYNNTLAVRCTQTTKGTGRTRSALDSERAPAIIVLTLI